MEHSTDSGFLSLESTICGSIWSTGNSEILDVNDSPKTPEELFLEEKGGVIHPIFEPEDQYCHQRSTVPAQRAFNKSACGLHTEQFLEVMKAYQESTKDRSISEFDLKGKHSWDDVLRVVKEAEAKYLMADGSGMRRWITDKSKAVMPVLNLIPNGTYTSILCGGLKLVFGAAASISEIRGMVLETLFRIPGIIIQAEHCVETFPSDPALYDRAAELYLAILTTIEGITKWLTQKSRWKQVRALALGPLYTKSFRDKMKALDEAIAVLQTRVGTLRDGVLIMTEKVVERVETVVNNVERAGTVVDSTTKATLHHVHSLKSEVKDLNLTTGRTDSKVSSMTEDLKILTKSQDDTQVMVEQIHDLKQAKEQAQQATKIVLKETARTAEWMSKKDRDIRRLKKQIEMLETAANSLSQGDLIDLLGVSKDSPAQDLRRTVRANQSMELSVSHIAQGVFEGGAPPDSAERISPMSLMSSMVIESLEDMEPGIPIHFFCGSHTSSRDSIKGPNGMIRSLICQILELFSVNLDFISSRRYRDQLQNHKLDALCDCFEKLVKQLPMDAVLFCVIDSICFFEKKEWAEDCRKVVNELQDLADDDMPSAIFKLLITSPLCSRLFEGTVPSQFRLSLPVEDWNGRNGPTERQIRLRARRPVKAKQSGIVRSLAEETYHDNGGEESSDSVFEPESSSDSWE